LEADVAIKIEMFAGIEEGDGTLKTAELQEAIIPGSEFILASGEV
jgi:hypothetical protein